MNVENEMIRKEAVNLIQGNGSASAKRHCEEPQKTSDRKVGLRIEI
jgi:hypothetical protein